MKNLTLKIEQETQKRSLTQNDLKAQNQQLSSLRTSEKQLKQETNHLLDIKRSLEKQNQELRKSVYICSWVFSSIHTEGSIFNMKRMMNLFLFWLQRKTGHWWANEGVTGPVGSWTVFLCESFVCSMIKNVDVEMTKQHGSASCLLSVWAVMSHQDNVLLISVADACMHAFIE